MANTYTQCYFHLVFAVKNRDALIKKEWKNDLEKYITAIVQNHKHKVLAIGSVSDHIHIFIGMKPNCCLSDLVREIKKSSNSFINEKQFTDIPFYWQEGFGAFSYSFSQIDNVVQYIKNQKNHHHKKTFQEEYLEYLKKFEIEYNEKYLFDWNDD